MTKTEIRKMMRYELQVKEPIAMPNILGNCSFPVHTHRWKGVAISDNKEALEATIPLDDKESYRIDERKHYSN